MKWIIIFDSYGLCNHITIIFQLYDAIKSEIQSNFVADEKN